MAAFTCEPAHCAHTADVRLCPPECTSMHPPPTAPSCPQHSGGQHTPIRAHMLAPVPATRTCGVGWPAGRPSSGRGWGQPGSCTGAPGLPCWGVRNSAPDPCPSRLSPTVVTATLAETGLASQGILLLLASRLLFVAISVYYYYQVGRKPKKV